MDYASLLYGPVYAVLGVAAVLTVDGTDYSELPSGEPFKAIDKTAGVEVGNGVETLLPGAAILAADLAALGLAADQLDDAELALNGTSWRIRSARPLPSPNGEAAGEYLLQLEGL